ncbi:MAG: hypothetical protein K0S46_101 [Moraxellaceae bacterium]|nr:hypothetical protein [Moraxellaceae bacterium]
MSRLSINFAGRSGSVWPFKAMLMAGVLGSLLAIWERDTLLTQIAAEKTELQRLVKAQSRGEGRQSTAVQASPQARAEARRLVEELRRPWEAMLDELHEAARADLLITHLQPDAVTGRVLVIGLADSDEAFLAFVERLRRQPAWQAVEPVSLENRTDVALRAGKSRGFQLALQWRQP